MRNVLTVSDLTKQEIERIFAVTEDLKANYEEGLREPLLPGRVMALIFEKPSLRTRVSFETAMVHLGGGSLFLGEDVGWRKKRESVADFAQVLSQYVDVIVCRAFEHRCIEDLAAHCTVPVINGLTDQAHPCQALADIYTLREFCPKLDQVKLAFVGDANNVAHSLATACAILGIEFAIATPPGYGFSEPFIGELKTTYPNSRLTLTNDLVEAVTDAAAVYTDVWVSMGQEAEREERNKVFAPYQVNEALLKHAAEDVRFLHCLPAHRGEEVTDEVIDGPSSSVIQQAGNRMHFQKGLLAWLLGTKP